MIPTEAQEAYVLVAYLRLKDLRFTHIGNETGSSMEARRRAIRMKREGVSRGFPDYLVITKSGLAAIELKRVKGSKVAPEQVEWIQALQDAGTPAKICKGADEAIKFIEELNQAGTNG